MLCPICLTMLINTDAVAQVNGTLLCGHHAAETILNGEPTMRRSPSQRPYTRPPEAPAPTP